MSYVERSSRSRVNTGCGGIRRGYRGAIEVSIDCGVRCDAIAQRVSCDPSQTRRIYFVQVRCCVRCWELGVVIMSSTVLATLSGSGRVKK